MTINELFNETELAIFKRQANFSFEAYYMGMNGIICGIDHQSKQIFIGTDLFRNNVHPLENIKTVSRKDANIILLTFNDLSSREIAFEEGAADSLMDELHFFAQSTDAGAAAAPESGAVSGSDAGTIADPSTDAGAAADSSTDAGTAAVPESGTVSGSDAGTITDSGTDAGAAAVPESGAVSGSDAGTIATGSRSGEDQQPDSQEKNTISLGDTELNELYSRLLNKGRIPAISYLKKEIGASTEDAEKYVDGIVEKQTLEEAGVERDFNRDGTMTKGFIISTLKKLKPGDKIHVDYNPFIGKRRVFEGEFEKLELHVYDSHLSVSASGDDYSSLADDLIDRLFDYIELYFYNEGNTSDVSVRLKRVTMLKKME